MIDQIAKVNMSYLIELLKDVEFANKQYEFLMRFLHEKKCLFKNKPFPTLLKPHFISPQQTRILVYAVEKISSALAKFIDLYLRDEEVRRLMGFRDVQNALFSIDLGYSMPLVLTRLDAFIDDYTLKFLEFNCDSPAGMSYSEIVELGFQQVLKQYPVLNEWKVEYLNMNQRVLDVLLDSYDEFRSKKPSFPERPTIAIVDWEGVSTSAEFDILKGYFERKGYETIITFPQKLTINRGRMEADGEPVHLIYKRVITRELLERLDEVEMFIQGIRDGLACVCNPFSTNIVGNKKVLALLTEPRFQHIFDEEELEVINRTIPWTKTLVEQEVTYRGTTAGLKDIVIGNKDTLVLKPASSYGGKDVFLGVQTDTGTWNKLVEKNIALGNWVVQEYVDIPEEVFPVLGKDACIQLKKVNINPYSFRGNYCGSMTRFSDSSIINVSQGGGLVPTMCVADMETVLDD